MSKNIIQIQKNGFQVYQVNGRNKKVTKSMQGFDPSQINDLFTLLKKDNTGPVRLLYSDEISYNLSIKKNVIKTNSNISKELLAIARKRVPDKISENGYSYASLNESDYLFFCPVALYFDIFEFTAKKLGVKIELVESETMAKAREADVVLSIANKHIDIPTSSAETELRKITRPKKKSTEIIFSSIIILITAIIIIFVLYNTGLFS